ncbi:hypothetical protein [Arthrobacter globiformis]|uniref:hypothetical protein n=1 Tax=Arthrobacter globiformis TaxID=1665 RepID=UPI002789991D|nr:hypothetical protein [Arthrobacter globiformis]MDQ0866434.1 hypothetical protein [Arthrobacter globiformis]
MKTRAALALLAGFLVTGSAALAVNTQALNSPPAGTGKANSVLLPNNASRTPAPAAVVSVKVTPDGTSVDGSGQLPTPSPKPGDDGDDKGGLRTNPEPGDDHGGQRKASEPGDDSGGHGSND